MAARFEYKVDEIREGMLGGKMSGDKLQKVLNDRAADGWQLRAITAVEVKGRVGPGGVEQPEVGRSGQVGVRAGTLDQGAESRLDLVVAGTQDALMMVESEAKELDEDVMLGAVMFAHRECKKVIEAIISLAEKAASVFTASYLRR